MLMSQMEDDHDKRSLEAIVCSQLAICYARTGQQEMAEKEILKGLDIEREDSGELSSRYASQLSSASHAWRFLDEERAHDYSLQSYEITSQTRTTNRHSASGLINLANLSKGNVSRRRKYASKAFVVLKELRQTDSIGDQEYVRIMLANAVVLNDVDDAELFDESINLASDVIGSRLEDATDQKDMNEWKRWAQMRDTVKAMKSPTAD